MSGREIELKGSQGAPGTLRFWSDSSQDAVAISVALSRAGYKVIPLLTGLPEPVVEFCGNFVTGYRAIEFEFALDRCSLYPAGMYEKCA